MIRSLRRKFILVNMILVFLVLAVVFTALIVTNTQRAVAESSLALSSMLARRDGQHPQMFEIGQKPPDEFVRSALFLLRIDSQGTRALLFADDISISDDDLNNVADSVLAAGADSGTLPQYNLRWMRRDDRGETRIAFIDMTTEQTSIRNVVLTSLLALAAALVAFFAISLFVSRWALRPVERAWEQQKRFVADASHELKTPLTVILACAGILRENRRDTIEHQMRWVDNTEAEATRMKTLVDGMLFLAKTDDAKTPVVHSRANLSDIVYRIALTVESLAFERGIEIDSAGIAPDIFVTGDESQLGQLASVLIENAIKYATAHSTVTVTLTSAAGRAALTVHNRGHAMTAEQAAHAFDRFYRADAARGSDGYGLGLAIAKSITAQHKGRISVVSSEQAGTTFTVSLPLA